MKLVTFLPHGDHARPPRLGTLHHGRQVLDLTTAAGHLLPEQAGWFTDLLTLLQAEQPGMDAARRLAEQAAAQADAWSHPLDQVQLLAPVPHPPTLRDCLAFERHLVQATRTVVRWRFPLLARLDAAVERWRGRALLAPPRAWYERPLYYKGNPHSVVGHEHPVRWPRYTRRLDYELEFGVFIGRTGCNLTPQDALQHVAGYTIFNDFSARDIQLREMGGRLGPAKGKDFDTGNVLGPALVTPDEIPDPDALEMVARVNGQEWSRGNSRQMHFSFADILAYISQDETLYPGDFIGAGTVPGGCGLELDRWLQPGDVVELEVEHLGLLRNQVVPAGA